MTDDTLRNYLRDLAQLVKEQARGAKADRESAPAADREYAVGRLMAYHEIVSLMQQQAAAFGIDLEALGLEDISPERDLT